MYTFLECGSSGDPSCSYLLCPDWEQQSENLQLAGDDTHLPPDIFAPLNDWQGVFVEPFPIHVIQLLKHLKALQPDLERWKIYQCALNIGFGFGRFIESYPECEFEHRDFGARLWQTGRDESDRKGDPYFYICQVSLDLLLDSTFYKPDYIRLDIEGSEYAVLSNYSFRHKPTFWNVELHEYKHPETTELMLQIFRDHGYDVTLLDQNHMNVPEPIRDSVIHARLL